MAERVEIMVVANDAASQVLRGVTSNFGALGSMVQNFTGGRVLETLTSQFVQFGKESVEATLKYANEVRNMTFISGESAEETSRFLQVLDDYKISATDAMAATRAMTKEGLAPNLETLAKLSDEYLSINDAQARNEFVIKNLGRAGLQWVEVLNKGSKALLEQGDAVSDMLILNQEQLDQARELEIAMDNWGDTIAGVQFQLGTELIPILTDFVDGIMATDRALELVQGKGFAALFGPGWKNAWEQARTEQDAAKKSMIETAEATEALGTETEKTKEQLKAEEDALKALTKANEEYLSQIGSLSDSLKDYEQKHADIQRELDEGNITLEEAQQQWQTLADEQELATRRMMLNMLQQQLAIDGLDARETEYLLSKGLEWGVYSQSAVDAMREAQSEVADLLNAFNGLPTEKTFTYYTQVVGALAGSNPQAAPGGYGYQYGGNRAGGGDVMAGMLYRVNETRTEYFKPSQNGTVMPIGPGGGPNGGVVVNLSYAPAISLADRAEIQTRLIPAIIEGVRKAKTDGII